jgi:hypothetical protein
MKKKKKPNISKKPDILKQIYLNNKEWKEIYYIEDKIIDIIQNIYYGKIIVRYEIYDLMVINLQFKIFSNTYECMISKRNNDYGFSICNIEEPYKYNNEMINKTINNDKFYLYNIYKMVFKVLQNI